jgi:hypothetical protein
MRKVTTQEVSLALGGLLKDAGELGPVLCGPILRKVTESEVHVFLVLAGSASVQLQVDDFPASPPARTVLIGSRAHAVLASAFLPLERGVEHRYDVHVRFDGRTDLLKLEDLELLGEDGIGYKAGALPSFSLPNGRQEARICHGSCRLPHGDGEDMLPLVDGLIRRAMQNPNSASERPHHLLLTGDQIYADDVHPLMLAAAREVAIMLGIRLGETIHGRRDRMSCTKGNPPEAGGLPVGFVRTSFMELGDPRAKPIEEAVLQALPQVRTRGEFIRTNLEITSEHSDCHLMFFGEYVAMYLLVWSDAFWSLAEVPNARRDKESMLELIMSNSPSESPVSRKAADRKRAAKFRLEVLDRIDSVCDFVETLGAVRRLLANVSVSTIFDDHEVTDDWNLNGAWIRKTIASDGTRQIVRNALTAYAVFQDWGNRPEDYREGQLGREILDYAADPDELQQKTLDSLLWLDGTLSPNRKEWSHVVRGAGYQILFLDARTHRAWASASYDAIPLVSRASLEAQFGAVTLADGDRLILVAGTPIFGAHGFETMQSQLAWRGTGAAHWDFESWAANEAGCLALIKSLARFRVVIVLSGDVHYSFANDVRLDATKGLVRTLQIAQFCCSALKNYRDANPVESLYRALADPNVQRLFTAVDPLAVTRTLARPDYSGFLTEGKASHAEVALTGLKMLARGMIASPLEGKNLALIINVATAARWDGSSRFEYLEDDFGLYEKIEKLFDELIFRYGGWHFQSEPAPVRFGRADFNSDLHQPGEVREVGRGYYVCAQAVVGVIEFPVRGEEEFASQRLLFRLPDTPNLLGQLRAEIPLDQAGGKG